MAENKYSGSLANMWSALEPIRFHQIALTLIVLVSFAKGFVWALLIPPLYGYDEPMHFMYGRNIESTHSLRVKSSTMVPLDIWELDEPAEKRTKLKEGVSARNLYHDDVENAVVTQPGFYTYHPPLYYCLVAAVESCLKNAGLVWEVFGCRLISICLGVGTAVLAYCAGRIFWREEKSIAPLVMATVIIYQPMSAFSFACISNSALEITLISVLLVVGMQVICVGFTRNLSVILTFVVLAGMMNKMSFVIAAPLVLMLTLWRWRSKFGGRKESIKNLSLTLLALALPATLASYWWYQEGLSTGGDSLVHSFETQIHPKPFSLIRYFAEKPWLEVYGKTIGSYFGHFGWKDAALSVPTIACLTIGVGICCLVSCVRAVKDLKRQDDVEARLRGFSVLFLTSATLFIVLFYTAVDMRVNAVLGGGWFTVRGQYYMSAIVGQALWVVSAIQWNRSTLLSNLSLTVLSTGAVLLNFYALLGVVVTHCFGVCDLPELFIRVANVQPFNAGIISGLFVAYVLISILLLGFITISSLWVARKPELKIDA